MPYLSKAWQGKLLLLARLLQEKLGRLCFHKVLLHANCGCLKTDASFRANTKPFINRKVIYSIISSLRKQYLNQTQQAANIIHFPPSASQAP